MTDSAYQLRTGTGFRGFYVRFHNGYTISVQFAPSPLNYCDGGKTTAEVAVIKPNGEYVRLRKHDDVIGHCPPERLAELMFEYSTAKKEETV